MTGDSDVTATEAFIDDNAPTLRVHAADVSVTGGPDAGRSLRIEHPTFVIGTGPGADLRLTDVSVSREHLRVSLEADGVRLRDGGSKNGTWLGAVRVSDVLLSTSAAVQLGRTTLAFRIDAGQIDLPLSREASFGGAIGTSTAMRHLFALLERVADSEVTVLLEGESGVGKEVLATRDPRAIAARRSSFHRCRLRRDSAGAHRKRALRTRARRVHGRRKNARRRLRASERRDAFSR